MYFCGHEYRHGMRSFLFLLAALTLLGACAGHKTSEPEQAEASDSLGLAADSLPADSQTVAPPRAVDGLFDDFIFSFMRNRSFQMERIKFPLDNYIDGVNHPIARNSWRFDRLYLKQELYTVIFDSEASAAAEKDMSLGHVEVEWVYLGKKRVKQYRFDKVGGRWLLTSIDQHHLSKNVNSDFYDFYHHFSESASYQKKHIRNPFTFTTYDFDNFQAVEGLLDVEQWPDYKPDLPKGVITNVNYGQSYGDHRRRVLLLCSPSGGMGCTLVFEHTGKNWYLTRLEN